MEKETLRTSMQRGLDELTELKDEIRVKLHLGGMDAKDAWAALEPELERQLADGEALLKDATDISRRAVHDLVEKARDFKKAHLEQ